MLTLFALNHYANLQARLRTRVTRDAAGLYLMAGGDTLLGAGASDPKQIVGRAGLTTLAELTVKALLQGEKPTAALPVYLDGTFFTGPGVNPGWDDADVASGRDHAYSPDCARIAHGAGQVHRKQPGTPG